MDVLAALQLPFRTLSESASRPFAFRSVGVAVVVACFGLERDQDQNNTHSSLTDRSRLQPATQDDRPGVIGRSPPGAGGRADAEPAAPAEPPCLGDPGGSSDHTDHTRRRPPPPPGKSQAGPPRSPSCRPRGGPIRLRLHRPDHWADLVRGHRRRVRRETGEDVKQQRRNAGGGHAGPAPRGETRRRRGLGLPAGRELPRGEGERVGAADAGRSRAAHVKAPAGPRRPGRVRVVAERAGRLGPRLEGRAAQDEPRRLVAVVEVGEGQEAAAPVDDRADRRRGRVAPRQGQEEAARGRRRRRAG
ncbi:hypothetical protein THAOC_17370, partial [Thalassiosira oceanica]